MLKYVLLAITATSLGGCFQTTSGGIPLTMTRGGTPIGFDAPTFNNFDQSPPAFRLTDPRYNRSMRDAGG